MGITLDGIVAVRNHTGKGVANIPALDDGNSFLDIPGQKDE